MSSRSSSYSPSSASSGSSRSASRSSGRGTRKTGTRKRTAARAPVLPSTEFGAIKRAKVDIQKHLLNTNPAKAGALREAALASIANADDCTGRSGRHNWRNEALLASNQQFSGEFYKESGRNFFNWYVLTGREQWGIDKMPDWARNGKPEPNRGTPIEGKSYTMALKSQPR
jgi:hypothetical protein